MKGRHDASEGSGTIILHISLLLSGALLVVGPKPSCARKRMKRKTKIQMFLVALFLQKTIGSISLTSPVCLYVYVAEKLLLRSPEGNSAHQDSIVALNLKWVWKVVQKQEYKQMAWWRNNSLGLVIVLGFSLIFCLKTMKLSIIVFHASEFQLRFIMKAKIKSKL